MPPRICFNDFDTEPPADVHDEDLSELQVTTTDTAGETEELTRTSCQLVLYRTLRMRTEVLRLLNGITPQIAYSDVLRLDADVCTALRTARRLNDRHGSASLPSFHIEFLVYLLQRFRVFLHAPFTYEARQNPIFHFSRTAGLEATLAILPTNAAVAATAAPDGRHLLSELLAHGAGLFRHAIRLGAVFLGEELLAQTRQQLADHTLLIRPSATGIPHGDDDDDPRGILARALVRMTALAARRVQCGETNVKLHAYLYMVAAEVRALEEGRERAIGAAVAQGAEESLRECYAVLRSEAVKSGIMIRDEEDEPVGGAGSEWRGGMEMPFWEDFDFDALLMEGL
jgi:hypothetical protein